MPDNPKSAWSHVRVAATMLHCGRPARALEGAEAGLRLEEPVAELYKVRGLALWKLGRHAEARDTLRRALELEPDDREAAMHLRLALEDLRI